MLLQHLKLCCASISSKNIGLYVLLIEIRILSQEKLYFKTVVTLFDSEIIFASIACWSVSFPSRD